MLSNSDRNTTHSIIAKLTLAQEAKNNVKIMRRIMSEKKTTLPSLKNPNWKTVKVETEKKK